MISSAALPAGRPRGCTSSGVVLVVLGAAVVWDLTVLSGGCSLLILESSLLLCCLARQGSIAAAWMVGMGPGDM